ncbi:unnamed protein product [Psylliodes chrysocephalus]|uniref:Flavin-containing monooxygenase n=1 Tax=Psylliodes chrysocephalus TaxID=3402493 RepID=A0A9P0CP88_9CUCU|nr:unnamed protein product [Psylliodes chrysocephala]
MRVAIVGVGAAGLASARHAFQNGFKCDVFEMSNEIGGTWVYSDDVGQDKYGYPIHSAMYQDLRTNIAKEAMGFPDFPVPSQEKSYLTHEEVLSFLNQYADYFKLRQHIKFNCMVTDIRPTEGNKWQLTYVFKPNKKSTTNIYDAVMICNGHYSDPVIPEVTNLQKFSGEILHSHSFRSPVPFADKRILTIGAGPSGLDVTLHLSKCAKQVYFSHHSTQAAKTIFPSNVQHKPDVKGILNEKTIEFVDGSSCDIDVILFCTGYRYNFPFLHESCGIIVDNNYVQPLYKHMIHMEKPTMCFIGIPFHVCTFQMFDLQARFFCNYLSGSMLLPSTEEMRKQTETEMENRWADGLTKTKAHFMGEYQENYYNDLAKDANTDSILPVYIKLTNISIDNLYSDLINFRENKYKIVDEENFVKVN